MVQSRLASEFPVNNPSNDLASHMQIGFCSFFETIARLGIFERRRVHLSTELAKRRRLSYTPTTDQYLRSQGAGHHHLTDDLGWLDELMRIRQEQLLPVVAKPVVTARGGTHP